MNNRRIAITPEFLQMHNLSDDPPPPDSLFFRLWNENTAVANQALATDYIQGIKKGTLDPIKYGAFTVNDAYYCYNGAQDYLNAESQAQDPTLKAFLLQKYKSYTRYNQSFTTVWHLRDASGIVPLQATIDYSEFEKNVASHQDPIYTLITMIPCEYLWYWLANQLAPPSPGNLYASWINGNNSAAGAYAMGNFIEQYRATHPVDFTRALNLYSQAMNYELQNFTAATSAVF
jgi:thiaminase/transcriptional activator TenA